MSWQHFKTQVLRKLTKVIKDIKDEEKKKNRFNIIMLFALSVAIEHRFKLKSFDACSSFPQNSWISYLVYGLDLVTRCYQGRVGKKWINYQISPKCQICQIVSLDPT